MVAAVAVMVPTSISFQPLGKSATIGHFLGTRLTSIVGNQRVVTLFIASLTKESMEFLAGRMADGRLTPGIDRPYSFSELLGPSIT